MELCYLCGTSHRLQACEARSCGNVSCSDHGEHGFSDAWFCRGCAAKPEFVRECEFRGCDYQGTGCLACVGPECHDTSYYCPEHCHRDLAVLCLDCVARLPLEQVESKEEQKHRLMNSHHHLSMLEDARSALASAIRTDIALPPRFASVPSLVALDASLAQLMRDIEAHRDIIIKQARVMWLETAPIELRDPDENGVGALLETIRRVQGTVRFLSP